MYVAIPHSNNGSENLQRVAERFDSRLSATKTIEFAIFRGEFIKWRESIIKPCGKTLARWKFDSDEYYFEYLFAWFQRL